MKQPTTEELIVARNQCARIIALYGERYLPIFVRLENEIALRDQQKVLLKKAVNIGVKIDTQNGTQIDTQTKSEESGIIQKFNKNSIL